jgi:hypothetical protein
MDAPTPLDSALVIERLGGPSEVARLCECSPQAVSQWFGPDPVTHAPRQIPNSRLLFLKAIRPDVFKQLAAEAAAAQEGGAPAGVKADEKSELDEALAEGAQPVAGTSDKPEPDAELSRAMAAAAQDHLIERRIFIRREVDRKESKPKAHSHAAKPTKKEH